MKSVPFFLILILLNVGSFGQQTEFSRSFLLSSDTTVSVTVGGKLDRYNTVGKPVSYFWDLYKYYTPGFEPLQKMTLTNKGENTVDSIRIFFNDERHWQSDTTIINHLIPPGLTAKQKALMMWKTIYDNHVYFYKAENIVSPESNDLVKFFTVYGIADCYMSNVNLWRLNALVNNPDSSYYWGLNNGDHGVTEVKVDSNYAVLDADQGAFYLQLDNENLAGYDDIRMDEYLYIRTKKWTPLVGYYSPKNYVDVANYLSPYNYRTKFGEYPVFHSSSYFSLRPGESFSYRFDTATSYHQVIFQDNGERPTEEDVLPFIGNGSIVYAPGINSLQSYQQRTGNDLSCIIPMTSPFVFTSGLINGDVNNPAGSHFSVDYSTDQINWTTIYESAAASTINFNNSLDSAIATLVNPAVYGFYIRLNWENAGSKDVSLLIDSLTISTEFQISKFYFPKLKTGNNEIVVQSSSSRPKQLQLDIDWKEKSDNDPPAIPTQPLFPGDNSVVNKLDITFEWPEATDFNGDSIVDYHFQLSDDSLMRYPIVSNYDVYLRNIDSVLQPKFHSIVTDFLLPGKTYYWHVRALDSKGAWSDWSPAWKFVCNGPKQPLNFRVDTTARGYLLKWDRAENDNTSYFKIFAFIDRGFYPTYATYYDTCSANDYLIPFDKKLYPFYRVASIDEFGNQSATTKAIFIRDSIVLKGAQTFLLDSLSDNGYVLSYSVNTNDFIDLDGRKITAKNDGKAIIQIHYINDLGRIVQTDQRVVIVKKTVLNFTVGDYVKKYGEDNPPFNYTITGFDNGDDESVLDSLPRIISEAGKYASAGTYGIYLSGGGDARYNYVFDTGVLTIEKNILKISGDTITIKAGEPIPPLTYKIQGLLGTDQISDIDEMPVAETDPRAATQSGNYPVTFSGGLDNNYTFEFVEGLLKVLPSELVIYPNPSAGDFYFRIPEEMVGKTVRIFSANGKLVVAVKLNTIISKINLSNQPPGVYFFQLSDGKHVLQKGKFVIH